MRTEPIVPVQEQASTAVEPWRRAHDLHSPYARADGPGTAPMRTVPQLPSWTPFMPGINPSEKSIEPGAFPDTPTTAMRLDERALFEYNMGSWADTRARTTTNDESYHIPAIERERPQGPWNSHMGDVRQGIMTTQGPATDSRARVWPHQPSSNHLPKMYGMNHAGVSQSNLELLPTSAAPRGADSVHHGTSSFEYLPPQMRYVDEYGHLTAIAPPYIAGPSPTDVAGTPPSVKERVPSWCSHYTSESPEVPEPVLAAPKPSTISPAMPPMLPLVQGHPTSSMPEAVGPVPHPPIATTRSGRKRADIVLEGIPAVIHPTPYKCEWPGCNDRFRRNEHLKRHMTSHTGEKPFVCWIPGCGKSFSRSDNLNVHYSTTHSKRGGRNRYVATLDENSEYYDPSYRGDLTPDGLPVGRLPLNAKTPSPGKQQQLRTPSSMS